MTYIASVIVESSTRQTDKLFDYLVPDEMRDLLRRGMKVMVPFGGGNKYVQAYVIDMKEYEEYTGYKLKSIIDVCDGDIWLDDEALDLALYLKSQYGCTLSDAIRTILPSGTTLKESIQIKMKNKQFLEGKKYSKLVDCLESKKVVDFKELRLGISRAELFRLRECGAIELDISMDSGVKVKSCEVYKAVPGDKAKDFIENPGRLVRQAQVLESMLNDKSVLTLGELCAKYGCTTGVIKGLLDKELIVKEKKELLRNPYEKADYYEKPELTSDQKHAIDEILKKASMGRNITLIQGVTGCGKTEIYLNLVEKVLKTGGGAIVLVPEISLTPQTMERFMGRFGDVVAIMHSRLSDGERFDQWRRIKKGQVRVVVGARSAVFSPVSNLKLIIIDEEHEYSYKSEMSPRYDTREVAAYRTGYTKGMLVMGSATPSLESYYKASIGEYNLIKINHRIGNRALPNVSIVDMREEIKSGNKLPFSRKLINGMEENLKRGYQTILFLNRRGYSTFVSCRSCGYVCKCSNCDATLTYHMSTGRMICHYCGFKYDVPRVCPSCGSRYIKYFGAGTEKIEQEIKRLFPKARVLRMDMDTTRKKGEHERIYNDFKEGKGDILIGTQMISKGMDFKNVTLVGIIAADTILNLPDFRAPERTFQLITQVSGRAGRGEIPGSVITQTYDPDHYSIVYAARQDYEGFFKKEIDIRKRLNNPPFSDIIYVVLYSENESELVQVCRKLRGSLQRFIKQDSEMLGPAPCHVSKIKKSYRWHLSFKGKVLDLFHEIDKELCQILNGTSVKYSICKNPYNMF